MLPGGSVTGVAGDAQFSGKWERGRLQAGNYRFKVERSGNGFSAVDERTPATECSSGGPAAGTDPGR